MDVKIIRELGRGMFGTTYLVEKNNKQYALKRQKVLPKVIKKDTKYELWRELDFYKWIASLSSNDKKFFMVLYDYKIHKCSFNHIPHHKPNKHNKKLYESLQKSPYCFDMLVDLKDGTLNSLIEEDNLNEDQRLSITAQCLYILYLMHENGYHHGDNHSDNIMYKKCNTNEKITVTINNKVYKFKSYGYQISFIDYGLVQNKKFIKTTKELKQFKNYVLYNIDLWLLIDSVLIDNLKNVFGILNKKKIKKDPIKQLHILFTEYYHLYAKVKSLYLSLWNNTKTTKWFELFEQNEQKLVKKQNLAIPFEMFQLLELEDKETYCELFDVPYFHSFIEDGIIEVIKLNVHDMSKSIIYLINLLN